MSIQQKTPRRVTVTPADPKYTEKDIRKQHLRVAPYCRVSTGSEEQQTSFTAQMEYFTRRIADNKDWTMVKMYADKGITGTSAKKRPEFLKMIRDAEKGKIDLVITKSVSRFCRNTLDGLEYVRRLKKCGVGVYFEKENTNTLYMDNEMILTFMMSQAQSESESLSTNVKWGFRKRFANGVVYYHYDTLLGYRRGPDGEPEIDPNEAPVVRRIFARFLMGQSYQQICDGLMADGIKTAPGSEKWYGSTVKSILQNEKYVGDAVLQKTVSEDLFDRQRVKNEGQLPKYYVHDCHPAIIDRATFDAVQRGLKLRTKTDGSGEAHLLSGLVKCADCGSTMSKCSNGKRAYLRCKLYADSGKQKLCTRHSVRLDQLIDLVSDRIRYYVQTYYELDAADIQPQKDTRREALEQERKSIVAQLEKRSQALKTLYLDKVAGIIGEGQFVELNQSFLDEKSRLEQRLGRINEELENREQPQQQADLMEKARKLLRLEAVPRELVIGLIDCIEIGERNPNTGQQEVKISWKF